MFYKKYAFENSSWHFCVYKELCTAKKKKKKYINSTDIDKNVVKNSIG